eukprot:Seg2324.4 transcript_id=Seg2324.4/GoldUCD/mRNA.D3Y31 product="hypothetical protein" protein_id=Seg2324.4/GoldUCD/D3Y31
MKLLHVMLLLGLFDGLLLSLSFAMVSQNDNPKDVIDEASADGSGDYEIAKESEEDTKGNCRDETEENNNISDEEVAKEVKVLYEIAKARDKLDKDIEKAEMDDSLFALPQNDSEQDEEELFAPDRDDIEKEAGKGKCRNKKSRNYCLKAAMKGQCKHKKIREECNQACLVCCADFAFHSTQLKICSQDRLSLCNLDGTKKFMRFYCPKSCGHCGKAIEPPSCVSSKYGCCLDRKTAASAPVGSQDDGCPECKDKLRNGFCSLFAVECNAINLPKRKQMQKYCPKTCRVCKGPDGKPPRCMDEPKYEFFCPQYKDQGFCKTDQKRMKFLCNKTCKFCNFLNDHQDAAPRCSFLEDHGACQKYPKEMEKLCPFTCIFTTPPTIGDDLIW